MSEKSGSGKSRLSSHSTQLLKLSTSQYRREYKSGAVYHGGLQGNKKTGKGVFKWPNGACYDGEYTDNKRHGKGKQYWSDGAVYNGEFIRDLRHGFGQITFPDHETYKGQFHRDHKHGSGVYTWPDGTTFEGHFQNDKKEGFGTFKFASGNVFQGIYKQDERFGPGIMTYTDKREDVGLWSGERLIKLCSVMESAFLFQHFTEYNVNAGDNISGKVRRANSAWESIRKTPSVLDSENNTGAKALIPNSFPYLDILDGIRGNRGGKGPLECGSEELLQAASAGDGITVSRLLQEGHVHVDVADKTGYTALLAAAVNCHRDVINCLLDNGADVNKLNDEGLSVLAACHVLFYTKHTWKDNIAEAIPEENLFNYIQEDTQKGMFIHRNTRTNTSDSPSDDSLTQNEEKGTDRKYSINSNLSLKDINRSNKNLKGSLIEQKNEENLKDNELLSVGDELEDIESPIHIINTDFETRLLLNKNGFSKEFLRKTYEEKKKKEQDALESNEITALAKKGETGFRTETGLLTGQTGIRTQETSLFSILSVVSSTKNVSTDFEDSRSETRTSVEQNRQLLLTLQRRPHLEATVRLLLKRGADPNASSLPMPVLFFATKAADTAANEILLEKGANTSAKLSHEKLGIAPLHIAVALPDSAGIAITELLLKSGADPDIRDSAFGLEPENGRTPLHIACCREDNDEDACAVVRLLLEYGANPDLLCEGHSPLSLAICSGNDLAVDALLEYGADPSLKLEKGVGSALCATTSFAAERRRTPHGRIRLINKLMRAGANIIAPISVVNKFPPGTVVDYAYNVFYQDRKIAHTPYHALTVGERDCYNARRDMLEHLGDILRTMVLRKEKDLIEKQLEVMERREAEEADRLTLEPQHGILKSPERIPKSRHTPVTGDQHCTTALSGRVTFRLEDEAGDRELEAEVDREIEAITGKEPSPGTDSEGEDPSRADDNPDQAINQSASSVQFPPLSSSPGRDEHCGLRIAVMKYVNIDHMRISALATEALKARRKVMKNRFRYCYECGRSIGVRLSACTRCKEVFYCSKSCKLKAWNSRHREECVRVTGGTKSNDRQRTESPTPTTDPDAPLTTFPPTTQGRKSSSRTGSQAGKRTPKKMDKVKKTSPGSRAAGRRTNTPSATSKVGS
ncbi:ankyrin repeat and MYND domain-containing protein 1-like [Nematostella vectensis]|nr:ankyrin repeat and MYND domain-containing protein 1-like [Nematostella vectensis]